MLDYEKLDVYNCSIEHLAFVFKAMPLVPRGYSALVDQWRRAAVSVPLNIAEAVGKTSEADRRNRYAIARGEAMECGAILDVVRLLEVAPDVELARAKNLIVRIVGMLTKLCQ
ncbi:MAG: four helix bundle protein [Kofleriaceae bacterium]|nr:four helix bundle protein [Kofleriaceae bacterium]